MIMKHPIAAIGYALLGVVAAGAPLLYFAKLPAPEAGKETTPAAEAAMVSTPVLVRSTEGAEEICIRREGREILRLTPDCNGMWCGTLPLPDVSPGTVVELEVQTRWTNALPANKAITIEIMPPGRRAVSDTQWTDTGAGELHAIFIFRW